MSSFLIGDEAPKAMNNLARLRLIETILRDLVIDLTVCKLEGWDAKQYIQELKTTIDSVYERINRSK